MQKFKYGPPQFTLGTDNKPTYLSMAKQGQSPTRNEGNNAFEDNRNLTQKQAAEQKMHNFKMSFDVSTHQFDHTSKTNRINVNDLKPDAKVAN